MKKLVPIAAACAAMAVFAGCSSNSTDPGTAVRPLISAKAGSTWHLEVTQTDSTGQNLTDPIEQYDSIVATGLDYMGKSNVVKIYQYTTSNGEQYGYYALESNGDLSFWLDNSSQAGLRPVWLRMPFGTGAATSTVIYDSTMDMGGGMIMHTSETATYSHADGITLNVSGNTISADGVRGDYTSQTTIPGAPTQTTTIPGFYYYWSRDVGFAAKSVFVTNDFFRGKVTLTQTLKSYTLH